VFWACFTAKTKKKKKKKKKKKSTRVNFDTQCVQTRPIHTRFSQSRPSKCSPGPSACNGATATLPLPLPHTLHTPNATATAGHPRRSALSMFLIVDIVSRPRIRSRMRRRPSRIRANTDTWGIWGFKGVKTMVLSIILRKIGFVVKKSI
jgi:hypothetical protein